MLKELQAEQLRADQEKFSEYVMYSDFLTPGDGVMGSLFEPLGTGLGGHFMSLWGRG